MRIADNFLKEHPTLFCKPTQNKCNHRTSKKEVALQISTYNEHLQMSILRWWQCCSWGCLRFDGYKTAVVVEWQEIMVVVCNVNNADNDEWNNHGDGKVSSCSIYTVKGLKTLNNNYFFIGHAIFRHKHCLLGTDR